jgi:hypothetical protein
MITSFSDPSSTVVFSKKTVPDILYGGKTYSLSLSMYQHPREATIESMSIRQMDVRKTDVDIYVDPSVIQFTEGVSQTFSLISDSSDISTATISMRIDSPSGISSNLFGDGLCLIRQPMCPIDMYHTFSMSPSTSDFEPYSYMASNYWPTASLDLYFSADVDGDNESWSPLSLPDMQDSTVMVSRSGSWGIMDILAVTNIRWYEDEDRTILSAETPLVRTWPVFGTRIFISKAGQFSSGISGIGSSTVVVGSIWPTSTLSSLGYDMLSCNYWARGSLQGDLWQDSVPAIEISDGGLPIQDSQETAVYVLQNTMIDVQFSSSSSSSSTSSSSSSSSSINSSSSSSSLSSSSTAAMTSSSSSSSESSASSSSSSSGSSSSSSSSSTSSHSSFSSQSSSFSSWSAGNRMLFYGFDTQPDTMGTIIDDSGNGRDGLVATTNGGLGPPLWLAYGGQQGGCMEFSAGAQNTDYLYCRSMSGISAMDRGTIMFWMRMTNQVNPISIPFCISSGITGPRTEISLGIDRNNDRFYVSCTINDSTSWLMHTETGTASSIENEWTHIAIVHNGHIPYLYVNFHKAGVVFDNGDDKSAWISSLFSATFKADSMYLGGAPRSYSPYMALGFNGRIDELQIWDGPLSVEEMESAYNLVSSSSSSSSLSP